MKQTKTYENYPLWIPFISNLVAILIYALGAYTLLGFGVIVMILYLLYCLVIEINVLRRSCVDCYYYGKFCGLGKSKCASIFFKKGDPERFAKKEISWKSMIPDFLVPIFPIAGGIILLIKNFSWTLLIVLILLIILFFGGNAVIRGSLLCKHCKQRELGCPAERLFSKKK